MKKSIVLTAATLFLAADLCAQAPTPAPTTTPTPAPTTTPTTTSVAPKAVTSATSVAPPAPAFAAANLTPLGVRALAANCAACHGTNGNSAGGAIPGLAGLNKEYFVGQMKLFKEGKREATLMHQISKGYSDAEVAAMADFFAAQKK